MRTASFFALASLLLAACGGGKPASTEGQVSREPISVRGWIADIDDGKAPGMFRTVETEAARRAQAFQSTNVWVEGAPYVSGGVAETGAFILLDVPPHKAIVSFAAEGVPQADLVIEDAPPNADVLVPGLILKAGGVSIADPTKLQVRIAAKISRPGPTGMTAKIAGIPVPVIQVPINAMIDRRDYPNPPALTAPVATVK